MRKLFYLIGTLLLFAIALIGWFDHRYYWAYAVAIPLFLLGIYNAVQPRHTILRNFPVLGYVRYALEFIAPEIQQYFIERHTDGRPFSRQQRSRGKDSNQQLNNQIVKAHTICTDATCCICT